MATSETTNLQLVKYGAGTDNFIRTDYNGNLDKIDEFAGDTTQAIANVDGKLGGAKLQYFTVQPNASITLNYSYVAFIVVGRGARVFEGFVTYEGTVNSFHTNEYITVSAVSNNTVTITNGITSAMHGLMITQA